MQNRPLLTIIIPTRDRHDTLATIKPRLLQAPASDIEFIISDNYSTPTIADSLQDLSSNFKIIRTSSRVSMPENWRFALAHVTTPYVTIMGDDDILWLSRLSSVMPLLRRNATPVIFWFRYAYFWRSFRSTANAGLLLYPREHIEKEVCLKTLFSTIFPSTVDYQWLPSIYNSIISTSEATNHFGSLENIVPIDCISPDVASAFRICSSFDSGVFSTSPITISGVSHQSNGMNEKHQYTFFSEFDRIDQKPVWLNKVVQPAGQGKGRFALSLIHDYFCSVMGTHRPESSPDGFPVFFQIWLRDLFIANELAATKEGINALNLNGAGALAALKSAVRSVDTGFFPVVERLALRVPADLDGNEISLITAFLNNH